MVTGLTGCATTQKWSQSERIVMTCKEDVQYGAVICVQVFKEDFEDTLNGEPAKVGLPSKPSKPSANELDGDKVQ